MFSKMRTRPESSAPSDPSRDGMAEHYPCLAVALGRPAVRRWPCCRTAPQMEQTVPARVNSTWHWAHTAISRGHYLALGPGGLIQG